MTAEQRSAPQQNTPRESTRQSPGQNGSQPKRLAQGREHVVAKVDEIPPGTHKLVPIGRHGVGVYNVNGTFYAIAAGYFAFAMAPYWFVPLVPVRREDSDHIVTRLRRHWLCFRRRGPKHPDEPGPDYFL